MQLLYLLLALSPLTGCSLLFHPAESDGSVPPELDAAVAVDAEQSGVECDGPWSAWNKRMALRIGSTTENLVSFPILVTLDAQQKLDLGLHADGKDLRFSGDTGEELDYEIDTWGEVAQVWVKVPELRSGQATKIWVYGGNSQVSDGQSSAAVWDNEFRGVWHFSEDPRLFHDSTGKLDDGGPPDSVMDTTAIGEIGNSVYVGAATVPNDPTTPILTIPFSDVLNTPNGVTWEARVRLTSAASGPRIILGRTGSMFLRARHQSFTQPDFTVLLDQNNQIEIVARGSNLDFNEWHYVVGTYSTETQAVVLYVDGIEVDTTQSLSSNPMVSNNQPFLLGEKLRGHMDEARLSGVARSAVWIKTQYRSISGDLLEIGDAMSCPE